MSKAGSGKRFRQADGRKKRESGIGKAGGFLFLFSLTLPRFFDMLTWVMKMEKIVWQGLLYDFYGELLTERQRHIYEDVVFNDLSLSEIAREEGISRQGVHDLVRRCDKILEEYEEKLRLVKKFQKTKELAGQVEELLDEYERGSEKECLRRARETARRIVEIS